MQQRLRPTVLLSSRFLLAEEVRARCLYMALGKLPSVFEGDGTDSIHRIPGPFPFDG